MVVSLAFMDAFLVFRNEPAPGGPVMMADTFTFFFAFFYRDTAAPKLSENSVISARHGLARAVMRLVHHLWYFSIPTNVAAECTAKTSSTARQENSCSSELFHSRLHFCSQQAFCRSDHRDFSL